MLPLSAWQQQDNTSVTDVVNLLLSMAHVMAAEWQSALTHLHHVHSVDLYTFSSYLKGMCAVAFHKCKQD